MVATVVQHHPADDKSEMLPRLRNRAGSSPHERRVTTIALRLFDLLAPLHGLNDSYRKLLRIASLLHDAGRRRGAADHQMTGAAMLSEDHSLPLSSWERRCIAYLIRYHCGKVPPVSRSEFLQPGDGRRKTKLLLGFLCAADGLDSRRISATAIIVKRSDRRVRIQCLVEDSLEKAKSAFQRRRKFRVLEKALGLHISVRVVQLLNES